MKAIELEMPDDVYRKLEMFVESGGSVVALGGLPDIGMGKDEAAVVQAISSKLSKSDRVSVVKDISDVVGAVNRFSAPDISLDKPCRELFYLHRQQDGRDIYFISNNLDTSIRREVTLRCTGEPQIWHPTTGEVRPLNYDLRDSKTIVKLDLDAFEGVFIVF